MDRPALCHLPQFRVPNPEEHHPGYGVDRVPKQRITGDSPDVSRFDAVYAVFWLVYGLVYVVYGLVYVVYGLVYVVYALVYVVYTMVYGWSTLVYALVHMV